MFFITRFKNSLNAAVAAFKQEWIDSQLVDIVASIASEQQIPPPQPEINIQYTETPYDLPHLTATEYVAKYLADIPEDIRTISREKATSFTLGDGTTITIDQHQDQAKIPEATMPYYITPEDCQKKDVETVIPPSVTRSSTCGCRQPLREASPDPPIDPETHK